MHGQDRNIHGKVFGGYLMREAFDISYLTVLKRSKGIAPELLRVD
jgi:acyl-coenzyme A thioesterase 9